MATFTKADVPEHQELRYLGSYLRAARIQRVLSQSELAARSTLSQTQISYFEAGQRVPSLEQLLLIAQALDVSLQKLFAGSDRPGTELRDIAIELRDLGIVDLWVKNALVPGAFRRPEEIIALVLAPEEPDPRIVEAVPGLLAWNEIDPILLQAHGATNGPQTCTRLAWLADVTLAIDKQGGFPGGCRREALVRFTRLVSTPDASRGSWDSLGRPMARLPSSALWRRWRISYDATLDEFRARAKHLNEHREQPSPSRFTNGLQPRHGGRR
jgi:transcriptional regulator with XRE-family HTH domain